MANDEIHVPSLVLILVVSGLLIRHFLFRGTSSSSADGAASETAGARGATSPQEQRRAEALYRRTEAAVEHIQQIFPYADRREVWWDLRRNGINIAATTERILAGRLDTPPITFQPPAPPARPSSGTGNGGASGSSAGGASTSVAGAGAGAAAAAAKSGKPNLIQRYHLQDKVVASPSESTDASGAEAPAAASPPAAPSGGAKPKGWSSNKDERQALLKKRRDDMILEARRKMEAKIAAEKAAAASSS